MNHNTNSDQPAEENKDQISAEKTSAENQYKDHNGEDSRSNEEINERNCRFQPGDPLRFARVRFPGHAKSYPFLVGQRKLVYGQKVMAMSDRGMAVGYVNSFVYELPFQKSMLPLRSITRVASEEDIRNEQETYDKQKTTETLCQRLIDKHNLDMNLTHVEFTQFGKKVVFYFVAPARVDFRSLVKDLVAELRLRIELRQISVRDRSASMGALGPCGRELCCSSFLSRYGNVSIKMAKNQNLTLNYSKLNGVCGQLKCCLQYEDEVYGQKRKKLPKEGSFVETLNGEKGKIFRLHILSEQFDLLTEKGKIRRFTQSYFKKKLKPEEVNMPDRFENISDETSTVVGLNEMESERSREFEKEILSLKKEAGKYASEVFEELTGISGSEQQQTPQQKEAEKESELFTHELEMEKRSEGESPAEWGDSVSQEPDSAMPSSTELAVTEKAANEKKEFKKEPNDRENRGPRKKGPRRNNRRGNRRRGPKGGNKKPTS